MNFKPLVRAVMYSKKDEVGILKKISESFSKNEINLTITNADIIGKKSRFFIDFQANVSDPRWKKTAEDLEKSGLFEPIRVLGSYPIYAS